MFSFILLHLFSEIIAIFVADFPQGLSVNIGSYISELAPRR